jgi:transcriptional regulator with XRE-family HTH domain
MPAPREIDPGQSPLHWFGKEFRRARDAAGMTQGAFAAIVPCDVSLVSRIEGGELTPNDAFVAAIRRTFPDRDWLVRFCEASPRWNKTPKVPIWFEDYLRQEREAHTLRLFHTSLFPGPFQTADYARELIRVVQPTATEERVDELVDARLARQRIFDGPDAPNTLVVLDEAVLHRCIGSVKIMHEQLVHLATISTRPTISVQVIEAGAGAHPGLAGSFQIASVHGKPDMMLVEAVVEDQTVERAAFVQRVAVTFDRLRGYALACAASRDLLLKLAEEIWNV